MIYADTDFFLALMKQTDWFKNNADAVLNTHKGNITTSIVTFIELMLLSKKFDLEPVKLTSSVMKICNLIDQTPLKAAYYIKKGANVFDAFHAALCKGKIISSDHIFDDLNIKRIKLEKIENKSK